MNQVIISGNLVRDIIRRQTNTGKECAVFTVASDTGYGEKKVTDYIQCEAWGPLAAALDGLKKGSSVVLTGRWRTGSYEKNGQKVYTNTLSVSEIGSKLFGQPKGKPDWDSFGTPHREQEEIPF